MGSIIGRLGIPVVYPGNRLTNTHSVQLAKQQGQDLFTLHFGRNPKSTSTLGNAEQSTGTQQFNALSSALRERSLNTRLKAYETLKGLNLMPYNSFQRHRRQAVLQRGLEVLNRYGNGQDIPAAIKDLQKSGCIVLFKNDLVPPKGLSRDILDAYHLEDDEIDDVRSGETDITVGELLKKDLGGFIPKSSPRSRPFFLFNKTAPELNKALFWHEYFHYLQHQKQDYSKSIGDFYRQELEADQFVIDNRKTLKLSLSEIKLEIKVWKRRLDEFLTNYQKPKKIM